MIRSLFLLLALAGAWLAAPVAAAPLGAGTLTLNFDGFVADKAGVFSPAFEKEMKERLIRIQERAEVSVILISAPGMQGADPAKLADAVGKRLVGLGKLKKHWAVFLLVPADRVFVGALSISDKATAEALKGMEDTKKEEVLRNLINVFVPAVTPRFKEGDWEGGMRAGVDALERHLGDEKALPPVDTPAESGDPS